MEGWSIVGWMDGSSVDGWTQGSWMDEWVMGDDMFHDDCVCDCVVLCMVGSLERWVDGSTSGWMGHGCIDAWIMDGWMGGWMDI